MKVTEAYERIHRSTDSVWSYSKSSPLVHSLKNQKYGIFIADRFFIHVRVLLKSLYLSWHIARVWGEEKQLLSARLHCCAITLASASDMLVYRWNMSLRKLQLVWGSSGALLCLWSCVHGHSYATTQISYHHNQNYNQLLNKIQRQSSFWYKYCYLGRFFHY